jgi:hypothetical protein
MIIAEGFRCYVLSKWTDWATTRCSWHVKNGYNARTAEPEGAANLLAIFNRVVLLHCQDHR